MTNEQMIENFTNQLAKNVREAYGFMSDSEDFKNIGAEFTMGKKYAKIIIKTGQKSVHAFVDVNTLDLYKASSWNAPAKGIRFNLINDSEKLENILKQKSAYAGGYLYR